jgi:predicted nuclease of restriction endonuclease-like (RecB) superfamily
LNYIGKSAKNIVEKQETSDWGKSVVEQLSLDLRKEFPDMTGFSARNLWDMRRFYDSYKNSPKLRQLVAEIPWGHNLVILNSLKNPKEREWYLQQTSENGWSRAVLTNQIETKLYQRQVETEKVSNFQKTLPPLQSDLVEQTLKDPYIFDFLTLDKKAKEKDLERGLLEKIKNFLLELGAGFAFVGSQFHIEVEEDDFYIDLLFYHYYLRCFVAIDLKMTKFKPEYAGKMNFYLSALDDLVRHKDDQPSIGIILCKSKKKTVAEYALRDMTKPIGVSEYRTNNELESKLAKNLPNLEELERLIKEEDDI